jgi:hypothetical protein
MMLGGKRRSQHPWREDGGEEGDLGVRDNEVQRAETQLGDKLAREAAATGVVGGAVENGGGMEAGFRSCSACCWRRQEGKAARVSR